MTRHHLRNTTAMRLSPRCGAKTRAGRPCVAPAVRGKKRCRMHGGAPGSGAPAGNRNALKEGLFTGFAMEERRQANALLREARRLFETLNDSTPQPRGGR